MANALAVDITALGDKELERQLTRLMGKTQIKVVRGALRKSATRIKKRIIKNLSGHPVGVRTGKTREAFKKQKPRKDYSRGWERYGILLPTRAELAIEPDDKHYYPYALEYGSKGQHAKPYIRPAVDSHKEEEFAAIGKDIGKGIERELRK